MKRKSRFRIIILVLILGGALLYTVVAIVNAFKDLSKSSEEDLPASYKITPEDSSLFNCQYWTQLRADEIVNSKVRYPISFLFFGNDYELITYRMDLEEDIQLGQLIEMENKYVTSTARHTYNNITHNKFFNFCYLAGGSKPVSKLFMTLYGDSIVTTRKNDSLVSYHLICKNFSIRYAEDAPKDIFFVGVEGFLDITKLVPLNISLLKRGKALYLLLMAPHTSRGNVPADLLDKIIG
ncbi:hypothetical protein ACQ86N_15525 [Puia sp. P3]|uniref:hypothetical protein n=1 Tax=Puia sp. P3 TaxID=3423952 RepID=UPI003D66A6D8